MIDFLATPVGTVWLSLIGLVISALGFPLTVVGLRLTYLQAGRAKTAAETAYDAVENFKFKLDRHSAYRDVSQAGSLIDAAQKFMGKGAWSDASEAYENARRAIIRIIKADLALLPELEAELKSMSEHMALFCNKVDTASAGKGGYPNANKVIATIRTHYDVLAAVRASIEKEFM